MLQCQVLAPGLAEVPKPGSEPSSQHYSWAIQPDSGASQSSSLGQTVDRVRSVLTGRGHFVPRQKLKLGGDPRKACWSWKECGIQKKTALATSKECVVMDPLPASPKCSLPPQPVLAPVSVALSPDVRLGGEGTRGLQEGEGALSCPLHGCPRSTGDTQRRPPHCILGPVPCLPARPADWTSSGPGRPHGLPHLGCACRTSCASFPAGSP